MHAAPSVSYPVGRAAWAARLYAAASLLGFAAVIAWSVQSSAFGLRQAIGFAAVLACGCLAARDWLRSASGELRWDGVEWWWEEGADLVSGQPAIALDLQSRMLLRWSADGGGTRWFWLERKAKATDWEALRRAVYSRASTPVPPAGEPPPAAEQ
jgi:toxin CptA